jgi:putative ABC transport system permease protein
MWNRKKSNSLLIVEFFFCFLVLFVALYMAIEMIGHYYQGVNYPYQNIYHFSVNWPGTEKEKQEARETVRRIKQELALWPEVAEITLTANTVPFLEAGNRDERVRYDQFVSRAQRWEVDEHFHSLLKLPLLSGRWFTGKETASMHKPVVVTEAMEKEFFGEKSIGKIFQIEERQYKVVGVVNDFNVGKWTYSQSGYFTLASLDTESTIPGHFLIKFKKELSTKDYNKLDKFFARIKKDNQLSIQEGATLEQYNTFERRSSVLPVILISVVCGFLIINVIIGLFGILWQSIRYRRSEIGLRRAIGADAGDIYFQILGEVIILATFGIIPSALIAFHFPLLHFLGFEMKQSVYVMLSSALIIYVLVILCALYPSRLAAAISPADALHEN